MFGGWGNDYLNADDVLSSHGQPRTAAPTRTRRTRTSPTAAPAATSCIANTGGDRLIDWGGEFNSYLVPFAPFGMPTVSRNPSPQPPGPATRSRRATAPTSCSRRSTASDPARNGEPFGEIGLVLHMDAAWGDQHGGPRDPQPGHEHDHRDIHRTTNVLPIGSGPDLTASQIGPPPPGPVVLAPAITAASLVGGSGLTTFQLRFAGAAGAAVSYSITDGVVTLFGTTTIGNDGYATLTVDLSSLLDGTLTITAIETDEFGNTESYDAAHVTKDATPPAAPTVALAAASDTGVLGDWITSMSSPTFVVTGEATALATVYVDGVVYTGGTLTNGPHTVTATLTDTFGNTSAMSAAQTLNVSGASTFVTSMMLNGGLSLTNHRLVTFGVAATSSAGGVTVTITLNGVTIYATGAIAGAPTSIMLPVAEGLYTVAVTFTDAAANSTTLTRTVTLDMSGPSLTVSLSPPTNGMYYDVGGNSTLTWIVTDSNGVGTSSGTIEGQTISASGGHIDLDLLTAGTHTVSVTAYDAAGNLRTVSLSFTIRVTAQGLKNALLDGIGRGFVPSASFQSALLSQIQNVVDVANKPGNTAFVRLRSFISSVNGAGASQLTPAFKALLLSWANDLATRL